MGEPLLKGKVVVIGGASKNLGSLISKSLGAEGASVVVHYNSASSRAAAEETVASVKAVGGDAFAIQGDFTKVAEIVKVFQQAKARYGGIDIAINTVGKVLKKPIADTTEEEYDDMFAVNSKAAYFFIREAARTLNDGGKIVSIVTSLLGAFTGLYSTYEGSKAADEHFTRAAAKELGPRGISVTAVGPGPMDTPFFYPVETPESIAYSKAASMNGKLTEASDIVPIVKCLVTDGWWITGQTILANGGYTTK